MFQYFHFKNSNLNQWQSWKHMTLQMLYCIKTIAYVFFSIYVFAKFLIMIIVIFWIYHKKTGIVMKNNLDYNHLTNFFLVYNFNQWLILKTDLVWRIYLMNMGAEVLRNVTSSPKLYTFLCQLPCQFWTWFVFVYKIFSTID